MMVFLYHSKDRTVARFQTPIRVAAIQRSRETVRTILTDKGIAFWEIMLATFHAYLIEIIGR